MMHRRFLVLVAGLLGTLGYLRGGEHEPIPVPPLGPATLGGIPTPALPPALISPAGPHCVDAVVTVPPLPMGYHLPSCPEGCKDRESATTSGKKVCATVEEVKKGTKATYSVKEEEHCVSHPLGWLFGQPCGTVRTKRVLVKTLVPEEKTVKKCGVRTVLDAVPQATGVPCPNTPPTPVLPGQPGYAPIPSSVPGTLPPLSPMPVKPEGPPATEPTIIPALGGLPPSPQGAQ